MVACTDLLFNDERYSGIEATHGSNNISFPETHISYTQEKRCRYKPLVPIPVESNYGNAINLSTGRS